jgi:hypothetical protein
VDFPKNLDEGFTMANVTSASVFFRLIPGDSILWSSLVVGAAVLAGLSGCSEAVTSVPGGTTDTGLVPDSGGEEDPDTGGGGGSDGTGTSDGGPADAGAQPTGLILNEVAPSGEPSDWFELYNATAESIDLSEWSFSDDVAEDKGGSFGSAVIAPGAYLQVFVDDTTATFGVGSDEELAVFGPDGTLVVSSDWAEGAAAAGTTWARLPDLVGDYATAAPTPGEANRALNEPGPDAGPDGGDDADAGNPDDVEAGDVSTDTDAVTPTDTVNVGDATGLTVVINEVVPQAAEDGPDWVELYNTGSAAVDVGGWVLGDSDPENRSTLGAGLSVPAGGYLVLTEDVEFTFGLGKGDTVTLLDGDGATVDTTSWTDGQADEGSSWGRLPNGTGAFQTLRSPTEGAVNRDDAPVEVPCGNGVLDAGETCDTDGATAASCSAACQLQAPWGVVVNEVRAAGTDFIELRNNNTFPVVIAGWWLTDDAGLPAGDPERPFVLPAGTTLAPGAYLVLTRGTEFLFGLSDNGDGVTLYAGDAGRQADATTWEDGDASGTDTWARDPDGTGPFSTASVATPGAAN